MFIIAKTIKGHEYIYSRQYSVKCNSKKQAEKLVEFLNNHNDSAIENWKLKDNEVWNVYEVGNWENDYIPYKIKETTGKISIVENN